MGPKKRPSNKLRRSPRLKEQRSGKRVTTSSPSGGAPLDMYPFETLLSWGASLAKTFGHTRIETLFKDVSAEAARLSVSPFDSPRSCVPGKAKQFSVLLNALGYEKANSYDISDEVKSIHAKTVCFDFSQVLYQSVYSVSWYEVLSVVKKALSEHRSDPEGFIALHIGGGHLKSITRYVDGEVHSLHLWL